MINNSEMILSINEIVSNSAPRLLVCFCIDGSLSMMTEGRIKQINEGIRAFVDSIKMRPYAVDAIEVCIITFSGTKATLLHPFQSVLDLAFKNIRPNGLTPMWEAVHMGMDEIDARKNFFRNCGCKTYRPWLVVMSDGAASVEDITEWKEKTQARVMEKQEQRALKVCCVAIGREKNDLAELHINGEVIPPEEFESRQFFDWLSRSVSMASQEAPDKDISFSFAGQSEDTEE